MNPIKYINSIFGSWEKYDCMDIRPIEARVIFPIPRMTSHFFYTEKELKKLRRLGFSSVIGEEIMKRIESLSPIFLKNNPILLFDESPFYIAQAIWQHYQPTINVFIYKGGIKGLLKEAESIFKLKYQFVILYGETGVGKTDLLKNLEKKGEQILNLEEIARHNGSIFGNLSNKNQPSQESFIINLAHILSGFDKVKLIFVESEKFSLGKNIIPLSLTESLENGIKVRLTLSKEERVKRLIKEYAGKNDFKIKDGIEKLKFRIGKDVSSQITCDLEQKKYNKVAERLIEYFDKTDSYQSILSQNFDFSLNNLDIDKTAEELIKNLDKKKRLP
ncbi:hypothetical protein [Algoriphagus sp.]|uniref:hypothetical protein n=1 Tax=Algoriphagus sp. TaxID=1872435 RepID=UPI0025E71FD9|nr:hypothetical protein [Algoriphagus sp.]